MNHKSTILRILIISTVVSIYLCACSSKKLSQIQKKQIIAELEEIYKKDQVFAGIPPKDLFDTYGHQKAWEIFEIQRDSIGLMHQSRIKQLYQDFGYLGLAEVGQVASSNFWIVIQHADNDILFQQEMLAAMKKEVDNNNASKREYAMLEDRVNVNLEQPQRFGSQVTYNDLGQATPKYGLIDSINIEHLRKEYDMPSFREYYNSMTKNHFEMNKAYLEEKGILEPVLYE